MACKGIIFDMDGTLIDSMGYWAKLGDYFLKAHKLPPNPEFTAAINQMTMAEMRDYFNQLYGYHYTKDEFYDKYHEVMEPVYLKEVHPKPFVKAFLQQILDQGIKICIATATRHSTAQMTMEHLGMMDDFEFLISCSDIGMNKHHPDIYLKSCEMMGTSVEETVVFEDALYCVETVKKAGFSVVGIYEASASKEENDGVKAQSDRYICSYRELLQSKESIFQNSNLEYAI